MGAPPANAGGGHGASLPHPVLSRLTGASHGEVIAWMDEETFDRLRPSTRWAQDFFPLKEEVRGDIAKGDPGFSPSGGGRGLGADPGTRGSYWRRGVRVRPPWAEYSLFSLSGGLRPGRTLMWGCEVSAQCGTVFTLPSADAGPLMWWGLLCLVGELRR